MNWFIRILIHLDERRVVERLYGPDEESAADAFAELRPLITHFLDRYLARWLPSHDDRDDATAIVLRRIWQSRSSFELGELNGWWKYVTVVGRSVAIDRSKQADHLSLEFELSDDEQAIVSAVIDRQMDLESINELADEVWLGFDLSTSRLNRNLRVLAAQLFYISEKPWQEVLRVLQRHIQVDRAQLDHWLGEDATLRALVFHELTIENEELARFVLKSGHLSQTEQEIALLRYRYGMVTDRIVARIGAKDRTSVEKTLRLASKVLPFEAIAQELLRRLLAKRRQLTLIGESNVWKRIVFHYHINKELPHVQIYERVAPPAQVFGFTLTPGSLNVWLSGDRLLNQLIRRFRGKN